MFTPRRTFGSEILVRVYARAVELVAAMRAPNARVTVVGLLLSLLLCSGAAADCEPKAVTQKACDKVDEVRVQLRWLKTGQFAGLYAAEAQGFYNQVQLPSSALSTANLHHEHVCRMPSRWPTS